MLWVGCILSRFAKPISLAALPVFILLSLSVSQAKLATTTTNLGSRLVSKDQRFQIDGEVIRLMPIGEGLVSSASSRERNGMSVATLAGGWIHTTGLAPLSDKDGKTTVGLAEDGKTIVETNPTHTEQVRYSMFRLTKVLEALNASWKDVVDVKLYIAANSPDETKMVTPAMKAFYQDPGEPMGHGPAFTFIPVNAWLGRDFKTEISLTAFVGARLPIGVVRE